MKAFYTSSLALLLAITVVACGKKEAPAPAAPPATQAAQPTAPAEVTVAAVNLGNAIGADKRVTAPGNNFAKTDTIYAVVETQGSGTMTLKARWTFHKGGNVATVNESSQTISASGPAAHEFHVSMPTGWPTGDYQVEIFANDKSAGVNKFTVQ
ncbi:MAG TPA: hypothetical protein VLG93_04850 [Sulfuricaulis sp.]|nr:hypothetical protein [Sulfuricaulis sp.]